ncbi:MAG: T9SS type A sorting domain-containing protein [Melioribacteraceae bacterium]|nr:T9SS type A sorting domain-containing protein [Melioribacteraceae bacterium]
MKRIFQLLLFFIAFLICSSDVSSQQQLTIPPRPVDAISGSQFMESIKTLSIQAREDRIFEEISAGNIPNFLRSLTKIESYFVDANGVSHSVIYEVMPDYLAVGSDDDFCRIPMGPITAQKIADIFGATMPTSKLVDNIYINCEVKLKPVTYPWSNQSVLVSKFIEHNKDIENQLSAVGATLGQLVGGTKKDIIISNRITDPARTHHVVIYGWHQLNGNPIQPIYNGHINTYIDYSHGIRLINSQILIDSVVTDFKEIVTDEILYKILSNENGVMERPTYLEYSGAPEKPKSFGIINHDSDKLKVVMKQDSVVESYKVFLSSDGLTFSESTIANYDSLIITELNNDSTYFIKLKATNQKGDSPYSEVLACVPSSNKDLDVLIVNGFDRASKGNTYNFVQQHASALKANGKHFNSATNEAILDGIISLDDYFLVDYILGEESTVDESFNLDEQSLISDYLKRGGNLLVSGAEIAWDLDYKGSSTDKYFIWNYLKMEYLADAPFSQPGTYYNVHLVPNDFITDLSQFNFDNGTHGTYNVKYPDVVYPKGDAVGFIQYSALDIQNGFAGILFEGLFLNGSIPGKILALGFPFETIYPEAVRNDFMSEAVNFFYLISDIEKKESSEIVLEFNLAQNYPNPFNPSTTISYSIPVETLSHSYAGLRNVKLIIYDILGKKVATLIDSEQLPGNYSVKFDATNLTSGLYFYNLQSGSFIESKKMILLR